MTGGGWKIEYVNNLVDRVSLILKLSVTSGGKRMSVRATELSVMYEPQEHNVPPSPQSPSSSCSEQHPVSGKLTMGSMTETIGSMKDTTTSTQNNRTSTVALFEGMNNIISILIYIIKCRKPQAMSA